MEEEMNQHPLQSYQVGTLYHPDRTRWPENAEYNYRSNTHEIRLFFPRPKPIEVQQVKQGEASFALVVEEPIIFLVWKFGSLPWSDGSYAWHRVPEDERTLPKDPRLMTPQERQVVTTFMVNADNGILLAIRQVSFSHDFTQALHQAIREQAARPFDQVIFDRKLRMLYSQHDSRGLLHLAIARCKGGD
jgi:hypothetical protein